MRVTTSCPSFPSLLNFSNVTSWISSCWLSLWTLESSILHDSSTCKSAIIAAITSRISLFSDSSYSSSSSNRLRAGSRYLRKGKSHRAWQFDLSNEQPALYHHWFQPLLRDSLDFIEWFWDASWSGSSANLAASCISLKRPSASSDIQFNPATTMQRIPLGKTSYKLDWTIVARSASQNPTPTLPQKWNLLPAEIVLVMLIVLSSLSLF